MAFRLGVMARLLRCLLLCWRGVRCVRGGLFEVAWRYRSRRWWRCCAGVGVSGVRLSFAGWWALRALLHKRLVVLVGGLAGGVS